jgi:tetratricopeptide (TPR) repeat protein
VEGRDLALKAKKLDPDNPRVYVPIQIYAIEHHDYDSALRAGESRLALEPKSPMAYNNLAVQLFYGGEPRRSIDLLTQAIDLDPRHPSGETLHGMCRAYFMLGDNDAAIEWGLRTLENNPIWPYGTYAYLAMAYAAKGEDTNARAAAAEALRLDSNDELSEMDTPESSYPAAYKKFYEDRLVPAWRKAGLPE